jgi:subtilisin family serine protease
MKKTQILARASLLLLAFSLHSFADDRLIIRVHPSVVNDVAKKHGLKIEKQITDDGVYVVTGPKNIPSSTVLSALKANALVQNAETNASVILPELSSAYAKSGHAFPKSVHATPSIPMIGAWTPYLTQPANTILRIPQAQSDFRAYGFGVTVAVIDTGIDYRHPVLIPVLDYFNAHNCVTNSGDASLNQETLPWVDQETLPWVDATGTVVLNQETLPWVDQETLPWVDAGNNVPAAYGHGTMVAGIVHLVAPAARIMPIKAFNSDGSGTIADVAEGIYWAVDHGAKVINMSFSAPSTSSALNDAIAYAQKAGVICVASTANDNSPAVVYPANINPVIGVGASTNDDYRASFSNYGPDVEIWAPGVAVVSTYPQNRYAAGWGTSFSTPYVTGTVALMKSENSKENANQALKDVQKGAPKLKSPEVKTNGRLDVYDAVQNAQ